VRRPASIVLRLLLLVAGLPSCGEDSGAEPTSGLGVELDASSGEDALLDAATPDAAIEAAIDAPSEPPPPPPELRSSECPAPDLPATSNPLDAVRALAVTETRFYVATAAAVYAFERAGSCPGARATGFGSGGALALRSEVLAGASGDRVLVATLPSKPAPEGGPVQGATMLLASSGTVTDTCGDDETASSMALTNNGGYAAFGSRVEALSVDATHCALTGAGFPNNPVFAIHAVAVDAPGSAIVASVASAGERPVLRRERDTGESELIDSGTACSVRALVRTQLGIATLDPTCNFVRFLDVPGERYRFSFAGEIGRALAAIPGTNPEAIALVTVSDPGVAPRWRVIEAIAPDGD
jgi:hypothetical protein